jgi:hypothetical protein
MRGEPPAAGCTGSGGFLMLLVLLALVAGLAVWAIFLNTAEPDPATMPPPDRLPVDRTVPGT